MITEEFRIFAEDNGISLEHPDDYTDWYKCWVNGYNDGVRRYARWNNGELVVGSLPRSLKECLLKEEI